LRAPHHGFACQLMLTQLMFHVAQVVINIHMAEQSEKYKQLINAHLEFSSLLQNLR